MSDSRIVNPDARSPFGTGLLKGLAVTIKHLFRTPSTQMYPAVKPDLPPRTRGVIGLIDENCTVCMLCSRECPDWCIYIDSHKDKVPPAKEGGRTRTRNVLDRFAIDFALCMYCGICIDVCPFDALFWSPEFEYSEYELGGLLHEMDRLRAWGDTVPPPPLLDDGADALPEVAAAITRAARDAAVPAPAPSAAATTTSAETASAAAPTSESTPSRPKPTLAEMEVDVAPQVDQEVFDRLVGEGKSERMARSKAKSAWMKARKAELLEDAVAAWEAEQAAAPAAAPAPESASATPRDQPPAEGGSAAADEDAQLRPAPPTAADLDVADGAQIDSATFDQLIDDGVSQRVARAKARAAWVRQRQQQLHDEEGS